MYIICIFIIQFIKTPNQINNGFMYFYTGDTRPMKFLASTLSSDFCCRFFKDVDLSIHEKG